MEKDTIKGLNTIGKKKIKDLQNDLKEIDWNLFSERDFVENIVSQRFNYFIVVFSLFITASATVSKVESLILILSLGILILTAIWLTIYISSRWLDIVFRILHNLPQENHLFKTITVELDSRRWIKKKYRCGVNNMLGIYIPMFCCFILIIGLLLVSTGNLEPLNK